MATLEHLAAIEELIRHEPDLESDEFPERFVYFAPEFARWVADTLSGEACRQGRNRTPHEQTEQILYDFIIGRRLAYGSAYHPLDPLPAYLWELKTPDMRLFGWFPRRRHFIIVCGELKDNLRKRSWYTPYTDRVVAFRNTLDLDEPKSVAGVRQDEVL
jgi:hypothetical protein